MCSIAGLVENSGSAEGFHASSNDLKAITQINMTCTSNRMASSAINDNLTSGN